MKFQFEHKATLLYLLIGAAWILFSDYFVNLLANDVETISLIQTVKGWFFVLATGILLFYYIQRNNNKTRKINRQLFQSRKKYLTMYEKAPVAFFSLNSNGQIVDVNPVWLKVLKYPPDEVIGRNFVDFIHPDFVSHYKQSHAMLCDVGQISDLRLRIRKKSSDYIIVSIEATVNKDYDSGEEFVFCAMKDITAENEAKIQLVNRESRYRSMFHKNMSVMLIVDKNGDIRESNNAAQNFYGYNYEELNVLNLKFILAETDDVQIDFLLKLNSADSIVSEQKHVMCNSDVKDVMVYASKIVYQSECAYYLIIHDITPQKNAEEQLMEAKNKAEESNRLIKSFLNNISHEIRTPMNSIMGFSQMLIRPNSPEEKKLKYVYYINESCHVLLDKITDTIDVSRIESDSRDVILDTFDLSFMIREVIKLFKNSAKDKQNKIVFVNKLSSSECNIFADKYKVRRVLKHILDNACKNTNKGVIQVKVFFDNLRNVYLIEIADSGVGVEEELQEKIFEPYVQVKQSPKDIVSGNGIGLTIVRAFVQQMGGDISLKSSPQNGTTVTVLIPDQNNIQ